MALEIFPGLEDPRNGPTYTIPEHLAGLDTLIPPVVSLIVMVPVSLLTQEKFPSKHEVIHQVPDDPDVLVGVC